MAGASGWIVGHGTQVSNRADSAPRPVPDLDVHAPVPGPVAESMDSSPDARPWPATEMVPGLWQSGYPEPGERWDAVIDLVGDRARVPDVPVYLSWPLRDEPIEPDVDTLVALGDLVRDLRRAGKRVLVHCAGGINRSALVVATALIRDGVEPDEAIEMLRARRPNSLNNETFVKVLRERVPAVAAG